MIGEYNVNPKTDKCPVPNISCDNRTYSGYCISGISVSQCEIVSQSNLDNIY